MSVESGAHPGYKERLIDARETILTELFGLGWPAPHRVVTNEATDRWLRLDPRGPGWLRAFHRASAPLLSRVPMAMQTQLAATQRPASPMFGPGAATIDGPSNLLAAGPLYAGTCIERIRDVRPARELVRELAA
jgi:NAD(P)H-dependent flavin oxidoreductase YrpB (nitropropane dioxygenase family)